MTERNNLFHYGIIVAAIALALDQASKIFLIAYFPQDTDSLTVTPFLNLVMVWNYGISFGMLAGHRQPLILGILSSGIVLFLAGWLWRCQLLMQYLFYKIGGAGACKCLVKAHQEHLLDACFFQQAQLLLQ